MPRRFRLRHRADFVRLRAEGRSRHHALLVLSVAANGLRHNRYGVITARRVGGAVQRNRVRRQLRAVWWHLHPCLRPGHDLVLVAKPALVGQPFAMLLRTVLTLARDANLAEDGPPCSSDPR